VADSVSFVAWSEDDKWLLSGGNDLVVKLWDAHSGLVLRDFIKHTEPVTAMAWCAAVALCPLPSALGPRPSALSALYFAAHGSARLAAPLPPRRRCVACAAASCHDVLCSC
jgi:hypothetical protein